MTVYLPEDVLFIMERLKNAGHSAYCVGGCVRDSLMGIPPKDYDITTSAKPEEMQRIFSDMRVAETGLKHGTLTVICGGTPYEVTTYRVDGGYTDHRHPDKVEFVDNIHQDLARRDFTVNAMAFSPDTGLVDDYGGQQDLAEGIIRCVGVPEERFREDALRILRGMRFASRFSFAIDSVTSCAIHSLASSLGMVAAERIRVELRGILEGEGAVEVIRDYSDVIFTILPELEAMKGFDQKNPHHVWDVWEHTLHALACTPRQETLRLAVLFHDCGKPASFTLTDDEGTGETGHFYGHSEKSRQLAEEMLTRLKMDNATFQAVSTLVKCHDIPLGCDERILRRRLNQMGCDMLRSLFIIQHADRMGTGTCSFSESASILRQLQEALDNLLAKKPCFTLKELAISGRDLVNSGYPAGIKMGQCLNHLLDMVIDGKIPNETAALEDEAARYYSDR